MIILGIDPGTNITGFGVVEKLGNKVSYIASGQITTGKKLMPERLRIVFSGIKEVAEEFKPGIVVIERAFAHKNFATAIKLGQARGVAMVAATQNAVEVVEYSPRQIKQAVVGYGNADKSQVQLMVKMLLDLQELPKSDAADALAMAICHCNMTRR